MADTLLLGLIAVLLIIRILQSYSQKWRMQDRYMDYKVGVVTKAAVEQGDCVEIRMGGVDEKGKESCQSSSRD